jgi:hypothetical protein
MQSLTLREIQKATLAVGDEATRWKKWNVCGQHHPRNLVRASDTRHYYCLLCGTIWAPDGTCQNEPKPPGKSAAH